MPYTGIWSRSFWFCVEIPPTFPGTLVISVSSSTMYHMPRFWLKAWALSNMLFM